jgi:transaldolase / glucose-6-phosphate isomerase
MPLMIADEQRFQDEFYDCDILIARNFVEKRVGKSENFLLISKDMLNSMTYFLPTDLEDDVQTKFDEWKTGNKIARVWSKDASVWTGDDESKWLGWLDSVENELKDLPKYRDFAEDAARFSDVVVLGMGGSSLCPEVLSITFDKKNFHVLDSTVPAQIKALESKLDLAKTLFIVASKSGSTLEPNTF